MDIEVKRMSPTAIEMLDQLGAVCKRFGVDYYAASQNQRDLLDSIALHEYQRYACLKVRLLLTMLHHTICTRTRFFMKRVRVLFCFTRCSLYREYAER